MDEKRVAAEMVCCKGSESIDVARQREEDRNHSRQGEERGSDETPIIPRDKWSGGVRGFSKRMREKGVHSGRDAALASSMATLHTFRIFDVN